MKLGSNPYLEDGKLFIEPKKWLVPIGKDYKPLYAQYQRLELNKTLPIKAKMEALASIRLLWQGRGDSNPN